jgi:hypothetical protein
LRQLRHGLCMCGFRGWMGKTKCLSAFERGMCSRCQAHWFEYVKNCNSAGFFMLISFPLYQEWSTTQRTPKRQLDKTVGVKMGQHPCGMLLTPCRVHAQTELRLFWGQKGVEVDITKVFLMFCTLSTIFWYDMTWFDYRKRSVLMEEKTLHAKGVCCLLHLFPGPVSNERWAGQQGV